LNDSKASRGKGSHTSPPGEGQRKNQKKKKKTLCGKDKKADKQERKGKYIHFETAVWRKRI